MPASELIKSLNHVRKAYPPEVTFVQQNLFDSHDVGRVLSMFNNPEILPIENFDHYFNLSRVKHGGSFRTTKPTAAAVRALKQAVIFQMTYPGAPMIYYGTEVGMWGANDPCDRQTMLWEDVKYVPEGRTPTGKARSRVRAPDLKLLSLYKRAISMRKASEILRRGELCWVRHEHARVLIYERTLRGTRVRVALNAGSKTAVVALPFAGVDLWTGKKVARGEVKLPPRGWVIVEKSGGLMR